MILFWNIFSYRFYVALGQQKPGNTFFIVLKSATTSSYFALLSLVPSIATSIHCQLHGRRRAADTRRPVAGGRENSPAYRNLEKLPYKIKDGPSDVEVVCVGIP